ncbi:MAG: hypothetical protein DMG14_13370 [Acidobacteria bacterium]|nr:MAG: hypothetical protein DMG14_13370 [Acidobacteriota bacterium]
MPMIPIVLMLTMMMPAAGPQATTTKHTPLPMVSGPITGPGAMFPGLRELPKGTEPADFDYVAKEYFVSGMAAGKPYTTRIVVRQPKDAKKFSGIVVSEVMHGSGNSWMFFTTRLYMMNQGHVHVEIASQKAPTEASIIKSNPERYTSLSIPDATQVNEITAQVGALIKANLKDGPFAGLKVRHSFLMGTSQSSGVLVQYLRQHAISRLDDGGPIFDGFFPTSVVGNNPIPQIDVPLVQMQTQTEVNATAAMGNKYRRPDSDAPGNKYRLYEMAGMPHNDSRENPNYHPDPCEKPVTNFPEGAMMSVGLHHLIQWVDKGIAPPHGQLVTVDNGAVVLDQYGNAKGGVQNTYVDVPIAKYGVPNTAKPGFAPETRADFYCSIAGYEIPLSHDQLKAMYKDHKDYEKKVEDRLKQLIKDGWFLPIYTKQVIGDAAKAMVP